MTCVNPDSGAWAMESNRMLVKLHLVGCVLLVTLLKNVVCMSE